MQEFMKRYISYMTTKNDLLTTERLISDMAVNNSASYRIMKTAEYANGQACNKSPLKRERDGRQASGLAVAGWQTYHRARTARCSMEKRAGLATRRRRITLSRAGRARMEAAESVWKQTNGQARSGFPS